MLTVYCVIFPPVLDEDEMIRQQQEAAARSAEIAETARRQAEFQAILAAKKEKEMQREVEARRKVGGST